MADGMRQMFDPFERVARAHHICPCCERPFSAEEEDEFVKKVTFLFLACPFSGIRARPTCIRT